MAALRQTLLFVVVFGGIFFMAQLSICWFIWQVRTNSGYTPDQGPLECAVETIKGHFE